MGGARFGSRWLGQVRRVAVVVSVILVGAADWLACSPIAAGFPTTIAGDGMYVVGRDIQPGTYATAGGRSCFWERLSGLSGEFDDVIANDFVEGQGYVTIAPTDVAFSTRRCPPWTLVSAPAAAVPALPRVTAAPVPAGALNVTTPIGRPACDGSGIVVFGSVTTPGEYDAGVQQLLNANPGASYLRSRSVLSLAAPGDCRGQSDLCRVSTRG